MCYPHLDPSQWMGHFHLAQVSVVRYNFHILSEECSNCLCTASCIQLPQVMSIKLILDIWVHVETSPGKGVGTNWSSVSSLWWGNSCRFKRYFEGASHFKKKCEILRDRCHFWHPYPHWPDFCTQGRVIHGDCRRALVHMLNTGVFCQCELLGKRESLLLCDNRRSSPMPHAGSTLWIVS